ncbi:uncharacterized protein BDZ99DRAFT_415439 [Mytilinidion resinicola]|uniref:Maintenance of mitochondrial morphology protein 1 n=1 Tax=Mytilinidion resinicola TaxID=574789 RepID=A0A6A6YT27_9PEZI|nr:uncharacterized protein BDZ99DRAFT_415439 [Mytilinidion resinicola]KAF2811067.1 hypothetical protein BDZ99DRAFT_415439 [Mytilinidion resinicola]
MAVTNESPPVPQGSSLSFTQGFLLGQLSIALLIFCFIKFFIFGEPPPADERALHLSSLRRARTLAHTQQPHSSSLPLRHKHSRSIIRHPAGGAGPSPTIATILAKTYYNVQGHQPESLDWFNVLIAQTIAQLRADARQDDAVLTSLTEVLNGPSKPDWVGEMRVTEIALGDEFPIFSNCRVMPAEESKVGSSGGSSAGGAGLGEESRLQARMDVDLSDVITLGVETTLVLNYPKPLVAVLPVALAVSVVRFSGTLSVSFIPSSPSPAPATSKLDHALNSGSADGRPQTPNPTRRPTSLAFTFLDDYRLDLSVRSLVGSRSRLQDVPKIAQLVEARLHAWFDERVVEPRFQQIVLPSLWPRKQNTRGGEEDEGAAEGMGDVGEAEQQGHQGEEKDTERKNFVPSAAPGTLETRMEAEGAKMREAEVRAGKRASARAASGGGMRWRGNGESGDWSGQRGMPGAMLGS